ncbi:hypothetical protein ACWEWG_36285 [Streptomyces sp. NPDC003758]
MAAHRIGLPEATLKRIASGNGGVPKWGKVQTYVTICYALGAYRSVTFENLRNLYSLWVLARQEERGTLGIKPLAPEFVRDRGDLSYALYALYERVGAPSLRDLQADAGGSMYLPPTTAARIVTRQTLPADTEQYKAFLAGCGITERRPQYKERLDAWYKVMLAERISTQEAMEALTDLAHEVQEESARFKITADAVRYKAVA